MINVRTYFSNPVVWDFGTTSKYKCGNCGHIAITFPEVLFNEIKDYRKKLQQEIKEGKVKPFKEELVDTTPGFVVGIFEISLLLIALILSVFIKLMSNKPYLSTILLVVWIFILAFVIQRAIKRKKCRYQCLAKYFSTLFKPSLISLMSSA